MFLSWSRIFFSISASVRVSSSGHHWSASPVLRMAISTVGRGFSLKRPGHRTKKMRNAGSVHSTAHSFHGGFFCNSIQTHYQENFQQSLNSDAYTKYPAMPYILENILWFPAIKSSLCSTTVGVTQVLHFKQSRIFLWDLFLNNFIKQHSATHTKLYS